MWKVFKTKCRSLNWLVCLFCLCHSSAIAAFQLCLIFILKLNAVFSAGFVNTPENTMLTNLLLIMTQSIKDTNSLQCLLYKRHFQLCTAAPAYTSTFTLTDEKVNSHFPNQTCFSGHYWRDSLQKIVYIFFKN